MIRSILVGLVSVLILPAAESVVTVDESASRVMLTEPETTVSLALRNSSDRIVAVRVQLEMLDPSDLVASSIEREYSAPPGLSEMNVALPPEPLVFSGDESVAWYRLRYRLSGDGIDLNGTVALANLCEELFELNIAAPPAVRVGETFQVLVNARHPVSGQPVDGVPLTATLETEDRSQTAAGTTDADGLATLGFTIAKGVVDESAGLSIEGKRGDLSQSAFVDVQLSDRPQVRIDTDKPIYQPEQTIHVRLLCRDVAGHVQAERPVAVRIEDPEDTAAHTAELTTNRFGVAHFDWRIPASVRLGDYRIIAEPDEGDRYPPIVREVKISRYELPAFSVTAKPDRAYYLPGQDAEIEIWADYLFGKTVAGGQVRLVREYSREWDYSAQSWDIDEGDSWESETNSSGGVRLRVPLEEVHEELARQADQRFADLTFSAYVTDPTTGRTEKRRFDLRVSRWPIHVYLIEASDGQRAFVSTTYADGNPVSCRVRVEGQAAVQTNRHGLARIAMPASETVTLEADDGRGGVARWEHWLDTWWESSDGSPLRVTTDRSLYRPGEAISVKVASAEPLANVVLQVLQADRVLHSQWLDLTGGPVNLEIPWREEFVHEVAIVAGAGDSYDETASRTVLYPADRDLKVKVQFERDEYRPGEEALASLEVRSATGEPVDAALGVAVVDAAVGERVRTDSESNKVFRNQPRTDDGIHQLGGVRREELFRLDSSKPFTDELDLLAEAMLAHDDHWANTDRSTYYQESLSGKFSSWFSRQFREIRNLLNRRYRESYHNPRDEATLLQTLSDGGMEFASMRDPWEMPYRLEFEVSREDELLGFVSAGPDKRFGTVDDLSAFTITRKHFRPTYVALRDALAAEELPSDLYETRALYRKADIDIDNLRDPWGTAYRPGLRISETTSYLWFDSAGPDRRFETSDDFEVGGVGWKYFSATERRLSKALEEAERFPRNLREWRAAVGEGPIEDAWGNPVHVLFWESSKYTDLQDTYTAARYGGTRQVRVRLRPGARITRTALVGSPGPDGIPNSRDDFVLATFIRIETVEEQSGEPTETAEGTRWENGGSILGVVTDITGARIPGAEISAVCLDQLMFRYEAVSDGIGCYFIPGLRACTHMVRVEVQGFRSFEMTGVPVRNGETTVVDVTMDVGQVSESVAVSAPVPSLQTQSSMLAAAVERAPATTPRLREYFPETLLWAPEVETGPDGRTQLRFPLADSITTWKLAALGSTVEGEIGVGAAEVRAFQPFFVDLNPPPVLTEGDEISLPVTIRNYLDDEQRVTAKMEHAPWFELMADARRQLTVAARSSTNVVFPFRAVGSEDEGKQQVTATSRGGGDAIARTVSVHPDGEEVFLTRNELFDDRVEMDATAPNTVIAGSLRAELKVYPSLLAHVVDAIEGIMERPYGCGEQTISSTYPSLLLLRYLKQAGLESPAEDKARRYVRIGLERLAGYQTRQGGFGYWSRSVADLHLTAYALRFLVAAREVTWVDEDLIDDAARFLRDRQAQSGEWPVAGRDSDWSARQMFRLTAAAGFALAAAGYGEEATRSMDYLARSAGHIDDAYVLASIGVLADRVGGAAVADEMRGHLHRLARQEAGSTSWELVGATPFHGRGLAGQLETTALAVRALAGGNSDADRDLAKRGITYLLGNKDSYGVWWSTQATVRVLEAIMASNGAAISGSDASEAEVFVDGRRVASLELPGASSKVAGPVRLDLSKHLSAGSQRVSLRRPGGSLVQAQLAMRFYQPWSEGANGESAELRLAVSFDRTEARVGDAISCTVEAGRVRSLGTGMMLAEIGLPPGTEVDRESLEKAVGPGRYDILPDRVVLYLWYSSAARTQFSFRPRFAMSAQSAPSILYAYYNPDARAVLRPTSFHITEPE